MTSPNARGSLLETLRLARGLTQENLADVAGISQATLSKVESGAELDDRRWMLLADALDVPASAFLTAREDLTPARMFHRKQKTTPMAAVRKIGADASLTRRRIDDLFGSAPSPPRTLHRHSLEGGFVTPMEVARSVRDELELGNGPIQDLTAVVEGTGALVLRWPLESLQVDAIATWPGGSRPVILIGDHVTPERQRFTMAHEFGHAILHTEGGDGDATDAQEREADSFAAELLLPGAKLVAEWPVEPGLDELVALKRRWGVSLSALIRRAADVGILDERQYRAWSIQLSTSGMHRREPEPIAPEQPQGLSVAIRSALSRGLTVDDLAERAHMYPREFTSAFLESA